MEFLAKVAVICSQSFEQLQIKENQWTDEKTHDYLHFANSTEHS
jgi:hypothetical protein